jgi:hypothetical protein
VGMEMPSAWLDCAMADALAEETGIRRRAVSRRENRAAIGGRLAAKAGKVSPAAMGAPAQQRPCGISGETAKSAGADETGTSGRSSEDGRDNITMQPVTAALQPVKVRSRRPPRVPCSNARLTGRVTFPRESSGTKPSAAGERCLSRSDRSRRASNHAGGSESEH